MPDDTRPQRKCVVVTEGDGANLSSFGAQLAVLGLEPYDLVAGPMKWLRDLSRQKPDTAKAMDESILRTFTESVDSVMAQAMVYLRLHNVTGGIELMLRRFDPYTDVSAAIRNSVVNSGDSLGRLNAPKVRVTCGVLRPHAEAIAFYCGDADHRETVDLMLATAGFRVDHLCHIVTPGGVAANLNLLVALARMYHDTHVIPSKRVTIVLVGSCGAFGGYPEVTSYQRDCAASLASRLEGYGFKPQILLEE